MILTLTAAFLLGAAVAPSHARCSLVIPALPTRSDTYVVLRATKDSASDGLYYRSMMSGVSRSPEPPVERARITIGSMSARAPELPSLQPREVFGQVMEVVAASGEGVSSLPRRRRVLVIRWGLGMSCQRAMPAQALSVLPGELFLQASFRDSSEWVAGMPTYDLRPRVLTFAPNGWRDGSPPATERPMRMREFLEMYRVLPTREAREGDAPAALAPLLAWAAQHRDAASKSPARYVVRAARAELDTTPRH